MPRPGNWTREAVGKSGTFVAVQCGTDQSAGTGNLGRRGAVKTPRVAGLVGTGIRGTDGKTWNLHWKLCGTGTMC